MSDAPQTAKAVLWIEPDVVRGVVNWPHPCESKLTTPEALQSRVARGQSDVCGKKAKVDYRGKRLCLKHAQARALSEVMGNG